MDSLPFIGPCEVCQKEIRNYRGLAGHLRHNQDVAHEELSLKWHAWKKSFRKALRCRKCGVVWVIVNPSDKCGRCPKCQEVYERLGKRSYEAWHPDKVQDARSSYTKVLWAGLPTTRVCWEPGDPLYLSVVEAFSNGAKFRDIMLNLGLSYQVVKSIGQCAFGFAGYQDLIAARKALVGTCNLKVSHDNYRSLSPQAKALLLKDRFSHGSSLERELVCQLKSLGISRFETNQWQSVTINGVCVPREADLKIPLSGGRKLVVLCDGEAFHGPAVFRGHPKNVIENDRQTALAFFRLGYSSVRYSETEIKTGFAILHLKNLLDRSAAFQKAYRNWCPLEELFE